MEPTDSLIIVKGAKKSPTIVPRLVVLAFAMICGVYICTNCLKQISTRTTPLFLNNIKRSNFDQICSTSLANNDPKEIKYLHYPIPKTFSREECACNPVRYFVIVSMQRSGSGWFETLLNSHVNVSSNGEIFGPKERRANASVILSTLDKVYNLDWFTSASKNECNAAVGFKWMLNQGLMEHHESIAEYLRNNGVHLIFLLRRNLLRRMVSILANSYDKDVKALKGTHKSHVHSVGEAKVLAKYKPKVNVTTLLSDLKQAQDMAVRAIEYFNTTRHMVVYYEDVVTNPTKMGQVQEFLRLPYAHLRSRQVKIHTSQLSKQVDNWADIYNLLTGTSYQSFLHSDYRLSLP